MTSGAQGIAYMTIRILAQRVLQDAGVERVLDVGRCYDDLSDVVARSLIATGAAVEVAMVRAAPETKPVPRLETKRGRTR